MSAIAKEGVDPTHGTDSDGGSLGGEGEVAGDYFGRAPRVGVDGALGLNDTDVEESGTESGRDSPVHSFKASGRRRGLNFTPVSPDRPEPLPATSPAHTPDIAAAADVEGDPSLPHHTDSYSASVRSLSSDSPTSSSNGAQPRSGKSDGDSSNMSSSWIGVEADADGSTVPPVTVDPIQAAAAAGLEPTSNE